MALDRIDLDAMERGAYRQADRDLAQYLCENMAPVLERVPASHDDVPRFVELAGEHARQNGYGAGRMYGHYIMTALLLGYEWMQDPVWTDLAAIHDDPGLDLDSRLNLGFNRAIAAHRKRDAALPGMLDITCTVLALRNDVLTLHEQWKAFKQLAALRDITESDAVLRYFETYEADFRQRFNLPPIQRTKLTAYQRLGYQHMAMALPEPVDDIRDLKPLGVQLMTQYMLLAMTFGRFYLDNPLLAALHERLKRTEIPSQQVEALRAFLQAHRRLLTEDAS
ncbi:hypothetical protein [Zestomonas carbonaria]|uniref:Uncharacterized protein n=1 Tax=Zestomonas carbonaria TaxID=2762745 RepID=A0A7U7ESK7_9GAMM|nr:hypothetical protein [Pseudomonas carbonaria]CAD5110408.1 hypothetical protein PSEWESI4_04731 [Pseudomonas carbonaria]